MQSLMNCPPGGCQRDVDRAHAFIFDRVCAEMDAGGSVDTFTVLLDLTVSEATRCVRVSEIVVGFEGEPQASRLTKGLGYRV